MPENKCIICGADRTFEDVHSCPPKARRDLNVGDRVPLPPKPSLKPAFTGAGKTSFTPARNGKK